MLLGWGFRPKMLMAEWALGKAHCFSWDWGGREGGIEIFIFSCSHHIPNDVCQVHNIFPRVISIAPRLDIVWFAQSSPLLTYIGKPKGRHYIFT
jgi:hypothetical protein